MLALHTAGDLLAFHPHIHGLFLSGVIQEDGKIVPIEVDQEYLQELFADKVLLALHREGLLTEEQVDNIKSTAEVVNIFSDLQGPVVDRRRFEKLILTGCCSGENGASDDMRARKGRLVYPSTSLGA